MSPSMTMSFTPSQLRRGREFRGLTPHPLWTFSSSIKSTALTPERQQGRSASAVNDGCFLLVRLVSFGLFFLFFVWYADATGGGTMMLPRDCTVMMCANLTEGKRKTRSGNLLVPLSSGQNNTGRTTLEPLRRSP